MDNNYIVAVYDFRSKQDYIYKTNKVKEIMGASKILEDAYSSVITEYNTNGGKIDTNTSGKFMLDEFIKSGYSACILYEGGGNLLMLYKSSAEFTAFNHHLSWYLIENAPGLSPICGKAEIDIGSNQSYDEIIKCVFADLGEYKRFAPPVAFADVLPFTQIDRNTSRPVAYKGNAYTRAPASLSAESVAKHKKYMKITTDKNEKYAKNLDDLVEEKGEESLLALIYVDGNAMGQKVKDNTKGCDFEAGVNKMRDFSNEIKEAFIDKPLKAIELALDKLEGKDILAMRRIIGGGDEITMVCNARNALKVADIYFNTLDKKFSSCMGIAIFHSHAPFADIYKIAEQCCESGKACTKIQGNANNSYIDAYFCRGAITGDMEELREKQEGERTKMPYCVGGDFERFKELGASLKNIARTNIKALRDAAFVSNVSKSDFELELMRVTSNAKKNISFELKVEDMPVLCDAAAFFDLGWFTDDNIDIIDEKGDESDVSDKNNVAI